MPEPMEQRRTVTDQTPDAHRKDKQGRDRAESYPEIRAFFRRDEMNELAEHKGHDHNRDKNGRHLTQV